MEVYMKIGILTFHSAHNHGAVLQALALQEYLSSLFPDTVIIDYRPSYLIAPYSLFPVKHRLHELTFTQKMKAIIKFIIYFPLRFYRIAKFTRFGKKYLRLSKTRYTADSDFSEFDLVVVGSDQIWNPQITNGFDPLFWGDLKSSREIKKIAYAASAGDRCYLNLLDENNNLPNLLNRFDAISVREKHLQNFLQSKGFPAELVIDPTLMDEELWNRKFPKKANRSDYILTYMISSPTGQQIVKALAQKYKKKVVPIFTGITKQNLLFPARGQYSPEEFVRLFQNAFFVVTESFHGTAFSIINRKNFYAVQNKTNEEGRISSLLSLCHLENRFISSVEEISDNPVDYSDENLKEFKEWQHRSKEFLKRNLT